MIDVFTLSDGAQDAASVASRLAGFLAGARQTLDVAIYDFALSQAVAAPVVEAFRDAVARGVRARVLYNVDHAKPIAVPPPPRTDIDLIARCGVQARPISGIPDLMHHKYVVRDARDVWTGSLNWTDDSFTREENVVATLASQEIALAYTRDFDELWQGEQVFGTGTHDSEPSDDGDERIIARFCPGGADRIAHRIAHAIAAARTRVRVCSPVITAGPILGTLAEVAAAKRVDLAGVYDATQMREVLSQWRADEHAAWKQPAFTALVRAAPFGGKRSTRWGAGTVHDFMHAKVAVADDVAFLGSYNLSHSGQENAENVLEISSARIAAMLADYIDTVRARYPAPDLAWLTEGT